MIKKIKANEGIEYKKLTPEEMKAKGILGRLYGPCADFIKPTRNGRGYSEQLWENVFSSDLMKEKIANGVCFGELGHPTDRTETDMEKIAICLREVPVKNDKGQLIAVFDILDTPNGRILKTLCDYGSKIGISSRGQGDLIQDFEGNESVDPDTYECECFDAVLVPAVKEARMQYVKESLDTTNINLKKALTESYNKASEEDKKIMEETLEKLNIKINEETEDKEVESEEEITDEKIDDLIDSANEVIEDSTKSEVEIGKEEVEESDVNTTEEETVESNDNEEESLSEEEIFIKYLKDNFDDDKIKEVEKILKIDIESEDNKSEDENIDEVEVKETDEKDEEAIDDGDDSIVESLKEALKDKFDLENNVKVLNEKLAVSDTKVSELNQECNHYKESIVRLSLIAKSSKDLKNKVTDLTEALKNKDTEIESQKVRIARLIESRKKALSNSTTLSESALSKDAEIKSLNETLKVNRVDSENQIKTLNEKLEKSNKEAEGKIKVLTENLNKATAIKESYKKLANTAVNKYIEVKATMLGMNSIDIKRKLGESYTMDDVDQVCEDLKAYQLNVSRLPWDLNNRKVSIRVTEAVNKNLPRKTSEFDDDEVSEGLIKLANLDN